MAIKRSCFHSNPPFAQGDIRIRSHPRASGKTLLQEEWGWPNLQIGSYKAQTMDSHGGNDSRGHTMAHCASRRAALEPAGPAPITTISGPFGRMLHFTISCCTHKGGSTHLLRAGAF